MTQSEMVSIELLNIDLWRKFHEVQNEMIITKIGRRMFPIVEIAVRGLDPKLFYALELEFVRSTPHRFRFHEGKWLHSGSVDDGDRTSAIFRHPESPNYGSHFTGYQVSFGKVKITNRIDATHLVCLNSHFKYHVQIHVLKLENTVDGRQIEKHIHTSKFPLTEFIAVTAYQNEMVTALKIKHNPFAKAFQLNHRYKEETEEHQSGREMATSILISGPPANRVVTPNGIASYKEAASLASTSRVDPRSTSVASWPSTSGNHVFPRLAPLVNNSNVNLTQNNFHPSFSSYDLRWLANSTPISSSCLYPSNHKSPITIAQAPFTPTINYAAQTVAQTPFIPTISQAAQTMSQTPFIPTIKYASQTVAQTPFIPTIKYASQTVAQTPFIPTISYAAQTIAQTPFTPTINYAAQTVSHSLTSQALPGTVEQDIFRQDCVYSGQGQFNMGSHNSHYYNQPCRSCRYPNISNLESGSSYSEASVSPVYAISSISSHSRTTSDRSSSTEGSADDSWFPPT